VCEIKKPRKGPYVPVGNERKINDDDDDDRMYR
jgi:hypothetical protein